MMRKKSSEIIQPNWSDLPLDILLLISFKLSSSFYDILSLKGVCSFWRNAIKDRTRLPYPKLVLFRKSNNYINDIRLMNIIDKRQYKFKKLCWLVEDYIGINRIIGSHPGGWVILLGKDKAPYIVHLVSEIQIKLPERIRGTDGCFVQVSQVNIQKAILSANHSSLPEHLIVVMCYSHGDTQLCIWKHGEINWSCFAGKSLVFDIVFSNKTLYAIRGIQGNKEIELWDLKNNSYLPEKESCITLPSDSTVAHCLIVSPADEIYLVNIVKVDYRTMFFIYKLESSKKRWITANSVNGQTIFLSFGGSVMLSSIDVERLGYKADCIYFMENEDEYLKLTLHPLKGFGSLQHNTYFGHKIRPEAFWVVLTI